MPFSSEELADLITILRDAAKAEVLPRFARLGADDVKAKSHASDLVTIADEAAERFIEARVKARYGDVLFVGEEIFERDKSIVDRLATAERAIVIDPIDGTFNYANGIPAFAMIAAVVEGGETVAGVLYDPIRDDWTSAIRGGGSFLEGPNQPRRAVRVAMPAPLGEMHGAVSWSYTEEPERSRILAGMGRFWGTYQYRCGGQEMKMIVEGGGHFALYGKLSPWDFAASALIHREAGGYSARFDGSPYRPEHRTGGLILAPDEASWHLIRETLLG
ncbi:inositol monophosphatase family protein [Chthonobacter albigriseus]|uniref:inositol monophosphatase family protein n=1 Tax=Chthonobacter albigriseus TaxID=1683161 RepID=UPI0015EEED77|nr:inositol monophosphatase [Chthonobacter albigriseus]